MTPKQTTAPSDLKESIKAKAKQLGFVLAGFTTPDPAPHLKFYEDWLARGHHAEMNYLAADRARAARANPRLLLPECKTILVLGVPYDRPAPLRLPPNSPNFGGVARSAEGGIASYALGEDYHLVLPPRLAALVQFIEAQVGHPVPNRYYTDTGPLLERDLAQRAGLGWIGKNTCLIHPQKGSYFLLAEILLGLELEPDAPFATDHCGTCTRCIEACPTDAILPNRSLDARRCISYLTIENKGDIPEDLRPKMQDWIFGCDICQQVCPWNKFSAPEGDASFGPRAGSALSDLIATLALSPQSFNRQFKRSPIQRAKRRGLIRNASVALGNINDERAIPALENAINDPEPLIREHAQWAIQQIENRKSKI
ncbi:MAG: tRNA epoxyqueuosine(34) reductase QueG [Chloroflexi bacterium]|nr:tRNA epoxyqueuosine(34) reductase QueG [Chloroflexota bacterium]